MSKKTTLVRVVRPVVCEVLEGRHLLHGVLPVTINFQPLGADIPGGTIPDYGLVYGSRDSGFEYGWNTDVSGRAVERNSSYTPYQRRDTFIDSSNTGEELIWRMDVHPGRYNIKLGVGDPSAWGDTANVTAEGKTVLTGTTTSNARYLDKSFDLDVTDGLLTITNGSTTARNKLQYITVTYVGPAAVPPTPAPTPDPTPGPTPGPTLGPTTTPTTTPTSTPGNANLTIGSWSQRSSVPIAKSEGFGATVGGRLYVFGGFVDSTYKPAKTAHVFNPATNKWQSIRDLPVALTHAGSAADGRYIYFAGGYPGIGTGGTQKFATTDVRAYDTQTNTYDVLPSLPEARGSGALALLGRTLYYMGGNDINRLDKTTVWALNLDRQDDGWQARASLPAARNHPAAVTVDGNVYFMAGQTGQDKAATMRTEMWKYSPATNAWTSAATLLPGRSHITSSTFVRGGNIVTIAGESSHNKAIRDINLYSPTTDTWSKIGDLPYARFSGIGGLIDDGTLVYAGGYTGGAFSGKTWTGRITQK